MHIYIYIYIYIYSIWYKIIHFSLHLSPAIQRTGNTLSKVSLDYISELININCSFNLLLNLVPKPSK